MEVMSSSMKLTRNKILMFLFPRQKNKNKNNIRLWINHKNIVHE